MKVGDLVMVQEGYHSLANHNNPPPSGVIALIVGKENLRFSHGCVYSILIGDRRWDNVYGSRLRLIKEVK